MVSYYDELEIEDFAWDEAAKVFHYPCPCGDRFEISKSQLRDGEEIATCPSCSLIIRVIYDYLDWEDYESSDDEDGVEDGEQDEQEDDAFDTPATSQAPSPMPHKVDGTKDSEPTTPVDGASDLTSAVQNLDLGDTDA